MKLVIKIMLVIALLLPVPSLSWAKIFTDFLGQTRTELETELGVPLETGPWWDADYVQMVYEQTWAERAFRVTYLLKNDQVQGLEFYDLNPESAPIVTLPSDWTFLSDMNKTRAEIFESIGLPKSYSYPPNFFESINYGMVRHNDILFNFLGYSLEKEKICNIGCAGLKATSSNVIQINVHQFADEIGILFHEPFWLSRERTTPLNPNSLEYYCQLKRYYIDETYFAMGLIYAVSNRPDVSFQFIFWKHAPKNILIQDETNLFTEGIKRFMSEESYDDSAVYDYGGEVQKLDDLSLR